MKKYLRILIVFLLSVLLGACGAIDSQVFIERTNPVLDTSAGNFGTEDFGTEEETTEYAGEIGEDNRRETIEEVTKESTEEVLDLTEAAGVAEDGVYSSKEEVAEYLYLYGHLPSNYMTKKEAEKLGWKGGSLEDFAPGMCIGGNRFGNYEGLLPEKEGRFYTECDIDTMGAKKRGAKRIVFSNDGLIYYTEDHYQSFELLYGEE
ncbi:MAG: ribonuclease [Lachnospiraceae bacterium]|nr:ribonuclease [Lachnospiraceae bacterium]